MRLLSCLACLVLFSSFAAAQNQLGFRLGVNLATLTGDLPAENAYGSRTGFVAGFFAILPLRHSFVFQPELLYTQKGFRNDAPSGAADVAVLELVYLEVPLLISYNFPLGRRAVLGLQAGPAVEFELSERRRLISGEFTMTEANDEFQSIGAGFAIGGDVTVLVGGFEALLGARYTRGFTDMLNEQVAENPHAPASAQNAVVSFFVGVHL